VLVVEPGSDDVVVVPDERWLTELHEAAIRPHITTKEVQAILCRRPATSVAISVLTVVIAALFRRMSGYGISAVLCRDAIPSVFDQRHIGWVLRSPRNTR
jgi:hypothetical protein